MVYFVRALFIPNPPRRVARTVFFMLNAWLAAT